MKLFVADFEITAGGKQRNPQGLIDQIGQRVEEETDTEARKIVETHIAKCSLPDNLRKPS